MTRLLLALAFAGMLGSLIVANAANRDFRRQIAALSQANTRLLDADAELKKANAQLESADAELNRSCDKLRQACQRLKDADQTLQANTSLLIGACWR